jgi:hypothetical protein
VDHTKDINVRPSYATDDHIFAMGKLLTTPKPSSRLRAAYGKPARNRKRAPSLPDFRTKLFHGFLRDLSAFAARQSRP